MEDGRSAMQIIYDVRTDVLYIRIKDQKQPVINRRMSDDIVLDMGEGEKIVGIEIVGASAHVNLKNFLSVEYKISTGVPA
jgi:uncharacterized protein YuzE